MRSNLYDYYELRLTLERDATVRVTEINVILGSQAELQRNGLLMFTNASGHPWIDLCVVASKNGSFNCSKNTWIEECNLIPVVCAKDLNGQIPAMQLMFLFNLARRLNWYLIQEDNEAGEEDVVLWSPN